MKLTVDNLNQQAYDVLKEKIIQKELPPGTRLVDSQLAEEFGISRTPLRDAIRKLAEEGLAVSNAKRGYYVYQPSAEDINEIFDLRQILDIAAVTKLIEDVLPNNPEAMKELKEKYSNEHTAVESNAFVKRDESFHDTIIRLAGNKRMHAIYTDLGNQTRAFRRATSFDNIRMEKANNYHNRIYQGLIHLDLDAAIDAVKTHVAFSRADALRDYEA